MVAIRSRSSVEVTHGAFSARLDIAGAMVGTVQRSLHGVDGCVAYVNGISAGVDFRLRGNDNLEFIFPFGRKGIGDDEPHWDLGRSVLRLGRNKWSFRSNASNVISILNALQANQWEPVTSVPIWMPLRQQRDFAITGSHGDEWRSNRKYDHKDREQLERLYDLSRTLSVDQIRDALTVLKRRTEKYIDWHQNGIGVYIEPSRKILN